MDGCLLPFQKILSYLHWLREREIL